MGSSPSTAINPLTNRAYGANTTGDQVATDNAAAARGRVVLITGGGGGLGYETACVLASVGARVYLTCRTQAAADKTAHEAQLKAAAVLPSAEVHGLALDLSSLASVRACAKAFLALNQPLHVLINNAGIMGGPLTKTVDGFESQFAVNHLGHFLLTELLLDKLAASGPGSRVVNVASLGQYLFTPASGIMFDDLSGDKSYDPWTRYGNSKLANVLHARELAHRHPEVTAVSLHPGNISTTDLGRHGSLSMVWSMMYYIVSYPSLVFSFKSAQQGIATTVFCALDPCISRFNGEYFMDCAPRTPYTHACASDDQMAARLWDVSHTLVHDALAAVDRKPAPAQ